MPDGLLSDVASILYLFTPSSDAGKEQDEPPGCFLRGMQLAIVNLFCTGKFCQGLLAAALCWFLQRKPRQNEKALANKGLYLTVTLSLKEFSLPFKKTI